MSTNDPQELRTLMSRIDDALARLRREIQRGKQLVRLTQEYQNELNRGGIFIGPTLSPHR